MIIYFFLKFNYFKGIELAGAHAIAASGAVLRILHNEMSAFVAFYHFKNVATTSFHALPASGAVVVRNANYFSAPAYAAADVACYPKCNERANNIISRIHIV
jgi:hypothetical protein